jgi:hypothetical protein
MFVYACFSVKIKIVLILKIIQNQSIAIRPLNIFKLFNKSLLGIILEQNPTEYS